MNSIILSAFSPFYGLITGDLHNVWWMTLANLAVLAIVVFLVLWIGKAPDLKASLPKVYGRAVVTSLLADVVVFFFRFLPTMVEMLLRLLGFTRAAQYMGKFVSDYTYLHMWHLDWNHIGLPWTIGCILLAAVFTFSILYFKLLKKQVPDKKLRLVLAILLAIFSAPSSWTNPAW